MRLFVVSCLVILSYVVAERAPVVLCGRQLANARVLLCYGEEYIDKRASANSILSDYLAEIKNNEIDSIWTGRRGALTLNWSRYKRGGLVDECCLKPCTTDVILNYC